MFIITLTLVTPLQLFVEVDRDLRSHHFRV